MRSVDCQVQFEGGPHHGAVVTLTSVPSQCWMVPSHAAWLQHGQISPTKASSGLQAAYLLTDRAAAGESGEAVRISKYRFLAFYAPALEGRSQSFEAQSMQTFVASIAAAIAYAARFAMRAASRVLRPAGVSAAS